MSKFRQPVWKQPTFAKGRGTFAVLVRPQAAPMLNVAPHRKRLLTNKEAVIILKGISQDRTTEWDPCFAGHWYSFSLGSSARSRQVSGLTASPDGCVSGSSSVPASMSSNDPPCCCCGEKGPCCCEPEQKPAPQLPDMALNVTSGDGCNYIPRITTSDAGIRNLVSAEHQGLPEVLKDTGPPLTSFYLANLNFRC